MWDGKENYERACDTALLPLLELTVSTKTGICIVCWLFRQTHPTQSRESNFKFEWMEDWKLANGGNVMLKMCWNKNASPSPS